MYRNCLCKISHSNGACNEVPFFHGYYVENDGKDDAKSFVLCEGCMRKLDKMKENNTLIELVKKRL